MSYADGLLSTGERVVYRTKQHPFIFIWGARWAILALLIALVFALLGSGLATDGFIGALKSLLNIVVPVLFIAGLVVFAWTALRYVNQDYVLTNRRVIQVEGVLNRNATDSSLEKINDAVLSQSVFGRMFDYGDLAVLTAAESGIERMHMLRSPIVFKKRMLDAKHDYEVDMERSGWQPGPPIRAEANGEAAALVGVPGSAAMAAAVPGSVAASQGTAAPAAAPMGASAPPPPPRANPDEVTRTLANLADLRDRGAITAEEYEAKKTDLLSRL